MATNNYSDTVQTMAKQIVKAINTAVGRNNDTYVNSAVNNVVISPSQIQGEIGVGKVRDFDLVSAKIANAKISTADIDWAQIVNADIGYADIDVATIEQLTADSIDAVQAKIESLEANSLKAAVADLAAAQITTANIDHANIDWASVGTMEARFGNIDMLNVKDMTAQEAIITRGVGNQIFISRLAVSYAQMVAATIGELVLKASNGTYWKVDVNTDASSQDFGKVVGTQVQPTQQEIEAGHTSDRVIVETDITAENMNTTNIFGTFAMFETINAAYIDVDQLFARQATIDQLNTYDIRSNGYLSLATVGGVSNNGILLNSDGIEVKSGAEINIDADADINIASGGTISIENDEGEQSIVLDEDGIAVKSAGTISIENSSGSGSAIVIDNSGIELFSGNITINSTNQIKIGTGSLSDKLDEKASDIIVQYCESTSRTELIKPAGKDWQDTAPAYQDGIYIWSRTKYKTGNTWHYKPSETGTCISGVNGKNTAVIYLYQRKASTPSPIGGKTRYTFSTKSITNIDTGALGDWSQSISSQNNNAIYVTMATAVSDDYYADIAMSAWSTPAILAKNGEDGTGIRILGSYDSYEELIEDHPVGEETGDAYIVAGDLYVWSGTEWKNTGRVQGPQGDQGLSSAAVTLYKRAASGSTPSVPSGNVVYTFSTGAVSGATDGWSIDIPTGTDPCYSTHAAAASSNTTYTIPTGAWSTPHIAMENGEDALKFKYIIPQYCLWTSSTEEPGSGAQWYDFQPDYEDGKYYWTRSYMVWEDDTSDTTEPVYAEGLTILGSDIKTAKSNTEGILDGDLRAKYSRLIGGEDFALSIDDTEGIEIHADGVMNLMSDSEMNVYSGAELNIASGGEMNIASGGNMTFIAADGNDLMELNDEGIGVRTGGKIEIDSGGSLIVDASDIHLTSSTTLDGELSSKAKIFYQLENPADDETIILHKGDRWIYNVANSNGELGELTNEEIENNTNRELTGAIEYEWDGTEWVEVSNISDTYNQSVHIDVMDGKIVAAASDIKILDGRVTENEAKVTIASDNINAIVSGTTGVGKVETSEIDIAQDHIVLTSDGYIAIKSTGDTENSVEIGTDGIVISSDGSIDVNGGDVNITGGNVSLAGADITISSNSDVTINVGSTFSVSNGNFVIDSSGNVSINGNISALSGNIGGWVIDGVNKKLYSWDSSTPSTYVALDSNTAHNYAIWAGAESSNNAPFRVSRDGIVYLSKIYVTDKDGNPQSTPVDLRTNYWKMDSAYQRSVDTLSPSADGKTLHIKLRDGTDVNFSKADSAESLGYVLGSALYNDTTMTIGCNVNLFDENDDLIKTLRLNNIAASSAVIAGWGKAYEKVIPPQAGTGQSFVVGVPSEEFGEDHSYTFTIAKGATPSSNGYASVSLGGTLVGRIQIGDWYTAGQGSVGLAASYGRIQTTTNADAPSLLSITGPSKQVIDAALSESPYTYQLNVTAGDEAVYTRVIDASGAYDAGYDEGYEEGSQGGVVTGWDLAKSKVVLPSSGTDQSFSLSVPSDTFNESSTYTFNMTKGAIPASDGYASVTLNGIGLARIQIGNWYTAGEESVTVSSITDPYGLQIGSDHVISFNIRATASNDATRTESKTVDASSVYNSGYDAGGATAKLNAQSKTLSYGESVTVSPVYTNHSGTDVTVTSRAITLTAPTAQTVSVSKDGNSYVVKVDGSTYASLVVTAGVEGTYNPVSHKYLMSATAYGNGVEYNSDSDSTGTEAFDDGVDSVSVSTISNPSNLSVDTNHVISFNITATASNDASKTEAKSINATSVYESGQKNVTLTAGDWDNGRVMVVNDYNEDNYAYVYLPTSSAISYNPITLASTDVGESIAKSVTINIADTTRTANLNINTTAVYNAGGATANLNQQGKTLDYGESITISPTYMNSSGNVIAIPSRAITITAPSDGPAPVVSSGWNNSVYSVTVNGITKASTTVSATYGSWTSGSMPIYVYADGSTRASSSISAPSITSLSTIVLEASDLHAEHDVVVTYAGTTSTKKVHVEAGAVYTAGQDSVTLSQGDWSIGQMIVSASNGKTSTVSAPAITNTTWTNTTGDVWRANVTYGGLAHTSATKDFSSIRTEGANSVTLSGGSWSSGVYTVTASNEKTFDVSVPTATFTQSAWTSANKMTVSATAGGVSIGSSTVDASSVYTSGANSVTLSGGSWSQGTYRVTASNGEYVDVSIPLATLTQSAWTSDHKLTVSATSAGVSVGTSVVDASSVYNSGVNSVTLSVGSWSDGVIVVTASNGESESISVPNATLTQSAWTSAHTMTVSATAAGVSIGSSTVDASSVYNSVTISSISNPTNMSIDASHVISFRITATASNGNSDYGTKTIDASSVYTSGYNDGFDDGENQFTSTTVTLQGSSVSGTNLGSPVEVYIRGAYQGTHPWGYMNGGTFERVYTGALYASGPSSRYYNAGDTYNYYTQGVSATYYTKNS